MAGWLKIIKRKHDSRTGHIIENRVTLLLVRNSSWNALDCFWFWGMPWSQELSVLPELSPLVLHTWKMNHIFPASFAEHVCNPAKPLCQTMFSLCGYFCLHHPSQRQHQYLWFLLLFSSPSPLHCPTLHIKLQLKSAYKVDLQLSTEQYSPTPATSIFPQTRKHRSFRNLVTLHTFQAAKGIGVSLLGCSWHGESQLLLTQNKITVFLSSARTTVSSQRSPQQSRNPQWLTRKTRKYSIL